MKSNVQEVLQLLRAYQARYRAISNIMNHLVSLVLTLEGPGFAEVRDGIRKVAAHINDAGESMGAAADELSRISEFADMVDKEMGNG